MGWFRRNEHDEEQLSAYLDGELTARQAENVEQHLATCHACAALLEELRDTRALLSALPTQTPGRSFVLGAEYARAPVRDTAAARLPSRRFSLALAPAVAASLFVALLFVDVAGFTTSSDESADTFTAASQRQASDEDAAAGSAMEAPSVPETANSTAEDGADTMTTKGADDPAPAEGSPAVGGAGGGIETPEGPPAALSADEVPTPSPTDAPIAAAGEAADAPSPEPLAFEAPGADDDGGISTLRILQIVAAAAFLASGFYVFVWPRVIRGGS
jgi:hypothetical protein